MEGFEIRDCAGCSGDADTTISCVASANPRVVGCICVFPKISPPHERHSAD